MEIQLLTSGEWNSTSWTDGGAATSSQPLARKKSKVWSAHGRSGLVIASPGRIGTSVVSMCCGGWRSAKRAGRSRYASPRCRCNQAAPRRLVTTSNW